MGNRAVITHEPFSEDNVGIYVHWNGGIESVSAFCQAAKELGFRAPDDETGDPAYGLGRLTGLISLYFGITGDTSLGIGRCNNLDMDGDNGTFIVGKDWEIVGWKPSSDSPVTTELPENAEPEKTALIRKQLLVGARLCATAFDESNKTITVDA